MGEGIWTLQFVRLGHRCINGKIIFLPEECGLWSFLCCYRSVCFYKFLKVSLNYDCILGSYEGPIQMNIILACRRITELFKMWKKSKNITLHYVYKLHKQNITYSMIRWKSFFCVWVTETTSVWATHFC